MRLPRIFIAGLGNLPYPNTRHSVGQLVVDSLAARLAIRLSSVRGGFSGNGHTCVGETLVDLTLFKSKSLMNVSGPSIVHAFRSTVNTPSPMIILTDSLEHNVGSLSVKFGGSANGHNGVKSIISALGGELGFYRFRIGIGRDGSDPSDYVMGNLSSYERTFWEGDGIDVILEEIRKVALQADRKA